MSKQKSKPYSFLLIDDDIGWVESLNRLAQSKRCLLKHANNLEDGIKLFENENGKSISGILLDIECFIKKRDEKADESFIGKALEYFDKKASHLPLVIVSGIPDLYTDFKKFHKGARKVYKKGRDEDEMLSFLKQQAAKLENIKIMKDYPDVFAVVEEYFNADAEEELISCLKDMRSIDPTTIKNNLACHRRLLEKIYIALNKLNPKLIPTEYIENGVKFWAILKHLKDNKFIEREGIIYRYGELIYSVTCDRGAHTKYKTPEYTQTKYTVQSITFALMDLILWMKDAGKK